MAITSLLLVSPLYIFATIPFLVITYLFVQSKRAGLDHIPGPWLAKYTNAWRCFQAWKYNHYKDDVNYQKNLLGVYGEAVRIGPNTVLVFDPEAINTVLGFKERLEKGPGYKAFVMTGTTQTALVAIRDEETHGRYRRPVAHAYSLSSLKGYEPYIDDQIQRFVEVLDEHAKSGKSINMSDWLHYWSFDVISKLTFGSPLGFMDHGSDFNGMIASQKAVFRYIGIVNNMPVLDALLKRNPLNHLLKTPPSPFFLFAKRAVEDRIAQLKNQGKSDPEKGTAMAKGSGSSPFVHPDLLSSFLSAKKNYPDVVTDLRVTHYCTTNVVAGANNSALSLDKTIQYLARNPDAQERMYREILDADASFHKETEGPAALELALSMPFLQAVTEESYRTFGSPANNLERVVSAAGMTLPSGHHLPPGTVVAMNGPSINRRKDVYGPDADTYNPLRWMKGEGESEEAFRERRLKMDRASLTFGHGSRSCIGKNVVQLEVYKIWATLVRQFTFEAVGTPQKHQVWVTVKRREKVAPAVQV